MKTLQKRNFGLDLIRTFAIIFVVLVHVFKNTNFYDVKISGMTSFILINIRWLSFICVPLFIILTGYLKSDKKVDKSHYQSMKKILIVYVAISIITIIYRFFVSKDFSNIYELFTGIFNSTAIDYAWYIEMYIGLFLLIPFLNILYSNIKDKKQKQIFLVTLFFICSIPQTISSLKIDNYALDIMPSWWDSLYPILYYFIGCYIKEYQIKIKSVVNVVLIISLIFLQSFVTYYVCKNQSFSNNIVADYNNFLTIIIATLFFILFYKLSIHGTRIRRIVSKISQLSLSMYLFSWMFDQIFYDVFDFLLKGKYPTFMAMIVVVPIVIVSSFLASLILDITIKLFTKLFNNMIIKHKQKYGNVKN